MRVESYNVNGFKVFGFDSRKELISYIKQNPGILLAVNAEKIFSGVEELRLISQNGVGYTDGIGAVMALRKKGAKNAIRIPGSELWLDIISSLKDEDSIYLIGSSDELFVNRNQAEKTVFSFKYCWLPKWFS